MNTLDYKNIQIADFLAEKDYLPISKKGANWWYLSPLHKENTASFKVNVDKNVWYDFGLGKGGGLATLVNLLYHPNSLQDYSITLWVTELHYLLFQKQQERSLHLSVMLK